MLPPCNEPPCITGQARNLPPAPGSLPRHRGGLAGRVRRPAPPPPTPSRGNCAPGRLCPARGRGQRGRLLPAAGAVAAEPGGLPPGGLHLVHQPLPRLRVRLPVLLRGRG